MRIPISRKGKRAGRIFGMRMSAVLAVGALISAAIGITAAGAAMTDDSTSPDALQKEIDQAAKEFGVPANVLTALSIVVTRGESGNHENSYGPLAIHGPSATAVDHALSRGLAPGVHALSAQVSQPSDRSAQLTDAAKLLKISAARIKSDREQSVRAAAVLLASEAKKQNQAQLPTNLPVWSPVVAKYATGDSMTGAPIASDVFSLLRKGSNLTTSDGQKLTVVPDPTLVANPQTKNAEDAAECPAELDCQFVGAAYAASNPADRTGYGNYDQVSDRTADNVPLQSIVLHGLPGTVAAAVANGFDPATGATQHFLVDPAGKVSQQVSTANIAWQAENWTRNIQSIGIGIERDPKTNGFTPQSYQAVSMLVGYLAKANNIPLTRAHVLAGEEVATDQDKTRASGDVLGSKFDWAHFAKLAGLQNPDATANTTYPAVQIIADPTGKAVKLYAEPSTSSQLIATSAPQGDSAAAGPQILPGQLFSVSEQRAGWVAVWYGDKKAWVRSALTTAASPQQIVTAVGVPKADVLASPRPQNTDYPSTVAPSQVRTLGEITPQQRFVVLNKITAADYLTGFGGLSLLSNSTPITSTDEYYEVQYGAVHGFVRADQMELVA